jgi:hypothetical protein
MDSVNDHGLYRRGDRLSIRKAPNPPAAPKKPVGDEMPALERTSGEGYAGPGVSGFRLDSPHEKKENKTKLL